MNALLLLPLAIQDPANRPRVLVCEITGEIDLAQQAFVVRVTRKAEAERPSLVIFEIDTPGGRGDAMAVIADCILNLKRLGIETRAFIRSVPEGGYRHAAGFSAGTLVALACRKIYMSPASVIGDAQPVLVDPQGGFVPAPEKIVSGAREKFAAVAEENGYPVNLAIAFVDPKYTVIRVVTEDGQQFLTPEELSEFERKNPDVKIQEKMQITQWGYPLTLRYARAVEFGLAEPADDLAAIFRREGIENPIVTRERFSWSETLARFLTSPILQSLLLMIGLAMLYMEIKSPGFGVPGLIGVACLAVLLFGSRAAGLAEMPEILLVVAGAVCVAMEVFLLPGTFVFAGVGIVLILAGMVLSMAPGSWRNLDPIYVEPLLQVATQVVVTAAVSLIGIAFLASVLPHVPVVGRLVLATELSAAGTAVRDPRALVGKNGIALTPLRPGGRVDIEGTVHDAVSEGEPIESGAGVRVLSADGIRLVVKKL